MRSLAGDHVWTASDVERSLWSSAAADAVAKPKRPAKAPAEGRKQAKGQGKLGVQQPAGTTKCKRTGGKAWRQAQDQSFLMTT